jgi:hypothetical protein
VLSLAPQKRLALSAQVVSSEPRPQPSRTELLSAQAVEGLPVASVVEESGVPPPPATVAAVEEEQTALETAAPKRHWSRQSGPARVAQMWSWCPRTKIQNLPCRWGIMTSRCHERQSILPQWRCRSLLLPWEQWRLPQPRSS